MVKYFTSTWLAADTAILSSRGLGTGLGAGLGAGLRAGLGAGLGSGVAALGGRSSMSPGYSRSGPISSLLQHMKPRGGVGH